MKLLRHTPDRPLPRSGSGYHRRGMLPSSRPAGRGAVPAGHGRGAGLAATIFGGVTGGFPPAVSSQPMVGGAVGNPVDGADATETPAPFAAPWLPPLPQLVASHDAFFPSEDNETPNKDH